MPPKPSSKPAGPSKKTEAKKKEKVIEDKTFGLKNKKGAKQQKFIQQVQKQVHAGPNKKIDLPVEVVGKKKVAEDPLALGQIIKPVQKVEKGADPKSILCAYFKEGQCTKGDKCKFSHDLAIERKAEKRSLYCDMREGDDEKANDTMDTWDDDKLKEVVEKKHGNANKTETKVGTTTDIICKFFLEAVEKQKYGWFWECPNGSSCHYRHALPPGFVLKRDKKLKEKLESEEDKISLEDLIEKERNGLARSGKELTKVNLESFVAWKKRKIAERKEVKRKEEEKKLRDFKAGNKIGLSGRDMFTFNPEMATTINDEDESDFIASYNNSGSASESEGEEEQDTNEYKEIQFDDYENMYFNDDDCSAAMRDKLEKLEIDEDLFDDDEDLE